MAKATSYEFNRAPGRMKRLADTEPLLITEHGHVTHVLLSVKDYAALTKPTVDDRR